MNLLYKAVAIIYKTYDYRGTDIPHFRAIMTIVLLFLLSVVIFGLLLNIPSHYILPWYSHDKSWTNTLLSILFFVLPILLLALIFSKKKLEAIEVTQKQINLTRKLLPICFVLLIGLMVLLLVRHGIRLGKI